LAASERGAGPLEIVGYTNRRAMQTGPPIWHPIPGVESSTRCSTSRLCPWLS